MSHIQDAVREWVWIVGADCPHVAWLLSDYDSWEANPHYSGPPQRHPEDFEYEDVDYGDGVDDPNYVVTGCSESDWSEDIPF